MIQIRGDDPNFNSIITRIKENDKSLETNIEFYWLSQEQHIQLVEALKNNKTIKHVILDDYQISVEGASALAEALKKNTFLKKLAFILIEIGDQVMAPIAEALKINQSLKELSLNLCKIGPAAASELAKALEINQSLEILDLRACRLGPAGASAIAEALKTNRSIKELNMNFNSITNQGLSAIEEALKKNYIITSLILEKIGNETTSETNYFLDILIDRNKDILKTAAEKFQQNKALSRVERESLTAYSNSNYYLDKIIFPQEQRELFKEKLEENFIKMISSSAHEEMPKYLASFSTPKEMNDYISKIIYLDADRYFAGLEPLDFAENNNERAEANETRDNLADMILQANMSGVEKQFKNKNNIIFIYDALKKGIKMSEMRDNLSQILKDPATMDLVRKDPAILGALVTYKSEIPNNDINRIIAIINHDAFKNFIYNHPREIAHIFKLNDPEQLSDAAIKIRNNPEIKTLKDTVEQQTSVNRTSYAEKEKLKNNRNRDQENVR